MHNKLIVIVTTILIFLSLVFLSFVEQKQQDITLQNNWVLYFQNPKDQSLDFNIENNSKNKTFHWELFLDKLKVREGDIIVNKSEIKTIPAVATDIKDKKITARVTAQDNTAKEIYKNL